MLPSLPDELTDYIIDFLHNDSKSLQACDLTCRRWLTAARYHLHRVTILRAHKCRTFSDLLDVNPSLGLAVRSLELYSPSIGSLVWEQVDLSFLVALPSVVDLTLNNMRISDSTAFTTVSQSLPGIRHLLVRGCWCLALSDFASLVSSFCHLSSMSVSILVHDPFIHTDLPLPAIFSDIRRIGVEEIVPASTAAVLNWLLEHPRSEHIETLAFRIISSAQPFHSLLNAWGSHLRHLELDLRAAVALDKMLGDHEFTLSACTQLQTFTLRLWLAEMCVPENLDLPWVSRLLSQLVSPVLQEVTFSLRVENMKDLRTLASECAVRELSMANYADLSVLDWDNIDTSLDRVEFSALRRLTLEGRGSKDTLEAYIRTHYPRLYGRRILVLA